ncbi:MAG TPA: hypothetical protein VLT61_09560 [Anaeromyxobacteraceae bacterium]|nr:hypothetical protein [Anaeromyxobacteraceae bacterium]
MVRSFIAAIFLATSASAAELPPATPIVTGPGDQTDPSLSSDFVAYLGSTARGTEIFIQSVLPGSTPSQQTFDDVDQGPPHLVSMRYAFRSPGVVEVRDLTGSPLSIVTGDGAFLGRTALSSTFVAWEEAGTDTGIDVGWQRFGDPLPPRTVLRDPGDQHSISVTGDWIAYVDGGSVKLVNTAADTVRSFDVPGTAEDVSVWAGVGAPLLAVLALPEGGDGTAKTIHVLDSSDGTLVASLATPGLKIHPRLFGEWVGFEASDDQIKPQVTLWHFTDASGPPWLFLPSPTGSYQKLHDLVVTTDTVRVVWSDDSSGDFDIYMFQAPLQDVLAPPVDVKPASCLSDARPLGEFTITRAAASPTAGGTLFTSNVPTPVLLCIEAEGVTAGWIGVGSQVVAGPGDFGTGSVEREVRLTVPSGQGRAGAVIGGGPGARLHVRIFADGGGANGNGGSGSDLETCAAAGDCPAAPPGLAKDSSISCATARGYGSLALLVLPAALLLAPRRRRSRR